MVEDMNLVENPGSRVIVLLSWNLDHVSVVVNIFGLLLEDKSLVKFGQNTVCCQKFHTSSIVRRGQNFGHEIRGHLFRLGRQYTKREFSKLGCGIVQQQLGEYHAG